MNQSNKPPSMYQIDGPPPGYLTAVQAAGFLGMTKQNFYGTGMNDCLTFWSAGPVCLYTDNPDVERNLVQGKRWLEIRLGLMKLGLRKTRPTTPNEEEWAQMKAGKWDATCPKCGGSAVGDGEFPPSRVWCEKCEKVQPMG